MKDLGASFELADATTSKRRKIRLNRRRAADDANDPRHAMAAGDYGSAPAAGALVKQHGGGGDVLEKALTLETGCPLKIWACCC